ncbi:MAG: helix-turn-helix domain-containing protein [Ruminiclostridium sp.]|nr:helix-turn-helix domain-containing protein [Ruminiclostridium sp.]
MQLDVEVLWISKFEYPEGYGIKLHMHNYYQIIYITAGEAVFTVEGNTMLVRKGYWLIIKPDHEHGMKKVDKGIVKTLDIKFTINSKEIAEEIDRLDTLLTSNDRYVPFILEKIRNEGKYKRYFFNELTSTYLAELLVMLVREHLPQKRIENKHSEVIDTDVSSTSKMIIEFINKHFSEKIALKILANHLGYNKNYLCMRFKRETGMTINNYIQSYRIYKAKELITFSDYDLKQICEKVGFEDIHHFSRIFKNVEGIPPGLYKPKEKDEVGKAVFIKENFVNPDKTEKGI